MRELPNSSARWCDGADADVDSGDSAGDILYKTGMISRRGVGVADRRVGYYFLILSSFSVFTLITQTHTMTT